MYPASDREEDAAAANPQRRILEPLVPGPGAEREISRGHAGLVFPRLAMPAIAPSDLAIISDRIDFLGLNNYFAGLVSFDPRQFPLELVEKPMGEYRTEMGWGINPEAFHHLLIRLKRDYPGAPIVITENGVSLRDMVNREGKVPDESRIDFLHTHIASVHRAIQEGVDIRGYYVWTLMDNFEWAHGFSQRFGLVYTDYATQKTDHQIRAACGTKRS